MTKLIQVFANKNWEADPLVAVLKNTRASPEKFTFVKEPPSLNIPLLNGAPRVCNARLAIEFDKAIVEVWCIQDLMDPAAHPSSSQEKARVLSILEDRLDNVRPDPSLVIAFGTAAFPDDRSHNGSVAIGSTAFVHYTEDPHGRSKWQHPELEKLLPGRSPAGIMEKVALELWPQIESRFVIPPLNPASCAKLILIKDQVALGSVNVTDDKEYAKVDPEAINSLRAAGAKQAIGSVETTHGLIRLVIPSEQFLFVSGIANRLGMFETEVKPSIYAQNFVAAHNAGVALAWMLPTLAA
jgi:hypothetical protein